MPNDDITHPIADLTGYITEGQILLSRELYQRDILPPINILPSLSRLMKDGIGEGFTRDDHPDVANQIFYAYSRVIEVRELAQVIGEDDLSEVDKLYIQLGKNMEDQFLNQGFDTNRDITETLDIMWDLLKILPREELNRIQPEMIDKYLGAN
jgi:V/A-type H+-transporting ATPase subunit B